MSSLLLDHEKLRFNYHKLLSSDQEVDPEGARTLAVLTKLDLMDHGTDALDVLQGQLIQVKLGIIGVVNRSQADIKSKKPIDEALRDEESFLARKYPTLASQQGTRYLAKTLNRLLMHHIYECLPSLKTRVNLLMNQCLKLLKSYGEPVEDKNRTLLQIVTRFSTAYTTTIEGSARDIVTADLCGGARISYIFHEAFAKALEGIDPLENLTVLDILIAIRNAAGLRPPLFVPEVAFELLVQQQIQRLKDPSLRCTELVHEELQWIVQNCGNEIQQEMARFPKLFERIKDVVASVLEGCLKTTNSLVEDLVANELAYINTRHPEFTDANLVKLMQDLFVDDVAGQGVKNKQRNAAMVRAVRESLAGTARRAVNFSPEVSEKPLGGELTSMEHRDCEIIERLIMNYFLIVRKNIQDSVPKSIMNHMVNFVRSNLQSELIRALYDPMALDELLCEDEFMAQKRKETALMLKTLRKAIMIIREVRGT